MTTVKFVGFWAGTGTISWNLAGPNWQTAVLTSLNDVILKVTRRFCDLLRNKQLGQGTFQKKFAQKNESPHVVFPFDSFWTYGMKELE